MPQLCSYKPKSSTKSNMIHWSPARMSAYVVDRNGEEKNWWSSPVISGLTIFLVPGSQQCIPWKRKMCPALLARFCLNERKICNTQLFKLTMKKLSSKINGKNRTSNRHKNCQPTCSARRSQGWKHPAFFLRNCSLLVGVPTIFFTFACTCDYVCMCASNVVLIYWLTHNRQYPKLYIFFGTGTGTATPFAAISGGATSRYRWDIAPTSDSAQTNWTRSKICGTVPIPTLDWNVLTTPVELGPLFISHYYQSTGGSDGLGTPVGEHGWVPEQFLGRHDSKVLHPPVSAINSESDSWSSFWKLQPVVRRFPIHDHSLKWKFTKHWFNQKKLLPCPETTFWADLWFFFVR